ncbi:amino acid adenylation domain-containing protein [Streptacidiphilus sp. PB12-B1b]|uniref:amino acid adenylation domain-containing protein n=1 Tax=Streptacidiphilus sp. PB12-B1b TaxID=2705012 RepID=UPI0015F8D2DC|nr:amino acid adenylation domain-containing protein [Streptacidiphilus sp. PB12-B1b]QMU77048.1 amino acid adenylation domain-containing protein [Streptacidiphilus sp. PB12-B1b]
MATWEELVRDVLGADVDRAAVDTRTFTELGGDPLRAVRLSALARQRLGLLVPVPELLADTPLARVPAAASPAEGPPGSDWDRVTRLWLARLEGVPTVLELPTDRREPTGPAPGGRAARSAPLVLAPEVGAEAAERAGKLGIPPLALLLAAFGLTLGRWTGARSLLVGVPAPDAPDGAGPDAGVGLLPVRLDITDDAPADDFLTAVQRSLELSAEAGPLPFEGPGHPLLQAVLGRTGGFDPDGFDLALVLDRSRPPLAGPADCVSRVWSRAEVAGFAADVGTAVGELAATSGPLGDVRCISAERRLQLIEANDTRQDQPVSSLDELFRVAARRSPDAVAVRDGAAELTYAQLAAAAAEQARRLRRAGVAPGDTVLIGLDRSAAEVVAVLGTVWAGAAYVGVDLSLPAAHTDRIIATCRPAAVLTHHRATVDGLTAVDVWDPSWTAAQEPPVEPPAADPGRLAYVAFTSGSTGAPKGVCVPHRAVIRLVCGAGYVRFGPGERVLRLSPLAFDASTLELWGALLNGATLEVYPEALPSPTELGTFLLERRVTVAWLTAGLFRLLVEFAPDSLASLRQLLTGGDVVPHDHAARALARHPGLRITNGYGPTENTTFTTTHTVTGPEQIDGPLPIGTPVPGTRVYVLDAAGRRLPPGAVGELYTGGAGLADGYLGDEAETARRFGRFSPDVPERLYRTGDLVRWDAEGRLCFLGRTDDQVKLRGYRIEPGAIGEALAAHPGVQDALVFAHGADSASKRLVAAVVPAAGARVEPAGLRASLERQLPAYMVPTLWTLVERLPVTPNGKVDRRALAAGARPAR